MVVKATCYLSRIVYSFIVNLDAVNFFAPLTSFQRLGYNIEYTQTECNNGGTLLYVKKGINYKLRKDLQIYKP